MSVLHSRVDVVIGALLVAVVVAAAVVVVDVVAGSVQLGGSGKIRPRADLVPAENVPMPRRSRRLQGLGFCRI